MLPATAQTARPRAKTDPESRRAPLCDQRRATREAVFRRVHICSGSANPELALEIAKVFGTPLGHPRLDRFADGEIGCELRESVRGADTYVVQPTCSPVNDTLMELLIMVDALRRASAGSITAVLPYY